MRPGVRRLDPSNAAQHLLDQLPIIVSVVDLDGRFEYLEGSGIARARAMGMTRPKTMDDVVPVGDPAREIVLDLHRQAMAGDVAVGRYEWRGRWQEARCSPIVEGDAVTGVLTIARDVDDEVRQQERSRDLETQFETFMRHCPTPAVIKDPYGRYVWANHAYFGTYRVPTDNWVGSTLRDHFPGPLAEASERDDQKALESGMPLHTVHHHSRPDGTDGVYAGYRFPLVRSDGRTFLGAVFHDISEDHRQRAELVRWRDQYQLLFDHSPLPMVVTDRGGVVLDANPSFCRMLCVSMSALRGRSLVDFTEPGDIEQERQALRPMLHGTARQVWLSKRYVRASDNARIPAQAVVIRVPDAAGDGGDLVGIVHSTGLPTGASDVRLTANEASTLELRAAGASIAQIASKLGLSRRGVDYHLSRLAHLLEATTSNVVARAYHIGVLSRENWPPSVAEDHRTE